MPYQRKAWCLHPVHINSTRRGSNPKHLKDLQIINATQANIFNEKIITNSERTSLILKAGDKV